MNPDSKRLKVGVITSAPAPYRTGLFERLAHRDDLDMTVYFLGRTCGPWSWDEDLSGDFPHEFLQLPAWSPRERYSLWTHPQIPGILKRRAFDAVVVGGYFIPSFLITIAWCGRHGVPYLLWTESHGGMRRSSLKRALRPLLVDPLVRGAAAHLAVSSMAREYLVQSGAKRESVFLVLNSPDVERISGEVKRLRLDRERWKAARGLGEGPVALFVGRMIADKGVGDLLEAYSMLNREGKAGALVMAGRGKLLDMARERINEEGWSQVQAVGFVPPDELPQYYAAADFFVLPSRHEPFGAVVHEALAAGLPVVVSDAVGSMQDLVVEGESGFVVRAGEPRQLALKMALLWEDKVLRESMGESCGEIARRFSHRHGEREFMRAVRWAVNGEKLSAESGRR